MRASPRGLNIIRMENALVNPLPHLDGALLRRLAGLHDDEGVVTVIAARGDASATEIRSTLRRVGPELYALAEEAAILADPHLEGAAHGFVATRSTHETLRFTLAQPAATLVTVASHVDLAPLARALDASRPVGIVDARLDHVRVVEASDGDAIELEGTVLSTAHDWTEYRGPSRANPLRGQESSSQRERYDRRIDVQRARGLVAAAGRIGKLARERHWRALVIGGDAHATGELAARLPAAMRIDHHLPAWDSARELAREVAGQLDDARRHATAASVEAARARPAAFGIGVDGVRAAVTDGRAHAVVVDGRALDGEVEGLLRHCLGHGLDVAFADGLPAELGGVICELHGTRGDLG
jgi:Bacterial archaeo-eukaryotic release factor family 10